MIYVVMGTTGEYSDRTEWPVMAYRDEGQAEEHVVRATRRAKEIEVSCYKSADKFDYRKAEQGVNEYDPDMHADYLQENTYFIYEVPTSVQEMEAGS